MRLPDRQTILPGMGVCRRRLNVFLFLALARKFKHDFGLAVEPLVLGPEPDLAKFDK